MREKTSGERMTQREDKERENGKDKKKEKEK